MTYRGQIVQHDFRAFRYSSLQFMFRSCSEGKTTTVMSHRDEGLRLRRSGPDFEIQEMSIDGWVRMLVRGELDMGTAPILSPRLAQLRAERQLVRLDLSELEFIDSTGIHLLIAAFNSAREDGCQLAIETPLSPQVHRVFELLGLDHSLFVPRYEAQSLAGNPAATESHAPAHCV
jgi:anti-sigma B factor antagonist